MHLLEQLNEPQRQAVTHLGGPVVVFAGAGSGKTRVITYRIAHLVRAAGVPAWQILAMTFTNKAAREMRQRLEDLLPGAQPWVGTFHSMCARLLRQYAEAAGVRSDFTIYDDDDQQSMLRRVLRDLQLDERRFTPQMAAATINRAKHQAQGPDEVDSGNAYAAMLQRIYRSYEERMALAGALDFGDIILRLVRAIEANATLRDELVQRFAHLLVDEFQDTNHVQYRLVRSLCSGHRNLCVVGDDDQSIYRWRGADRHHMLQFHREFPDATVIKLEQNYRSTRCILRAANAVIAHNLQRQPKELWTANDEGDKLLLLRCRDEHDEAQMMVQAVREIAHAGELNRRDIAILYRINAQSRVLEEALRGANIPYRVVGGTRFYDRAEVRNILAYLRVLPNPDDDASMLRIINTPTRGIGKQSIDTLLEHASAEGKSLWSVLQGAEQLSLKPAALRCLGQFRALIAELRAELQAGMDLGRLADTVLLRSGYRSKLQEEDTAEADTRLQNLDELVASMREFAMQNPTDASLSAFLEHVTLHTEAAEDVDTDKLTLMTVHAAKGLEFPVVMVTGMEERIFPYQNSEADEDPERLEEERRLAYVAMTRAEQRLILSYATSRQLFGQMRLGVPSRFLREINPDDVETIGHSVPPPSPYASGPYAARSPRDAAGSAPQRSALPGESYIDRSDVGDDSGLRPGMRVRHQRFGTGRVASISAGTPPRVTVDFPGEGRKQIVVDFLSPA